MTQVIDRVAQAGTGIDERFPAFVFDGFRQFYGLVGDITCRTGRSRLHRVLYERLGFLTAGSVASAAVVQPAKTPAEPARLVN